MKTVQILRYLYPTKEEKLAMQIQKTPIDFSDFFRKGIVKNKDGEIINGTEK